MKNNIIGFFASLIIHAGLFSAFVAFAGIIAPHEEPLLMDLSIITMGGSSGSGMAEAAGGRGESTGSPVSLEGADAGPGKENPVTDAKADAPEPVVQPTSQTPEPEKNIDPEPALAAKENRPPPKPQKNRIQKAVAKEARRDNGPPSVSPRKNTESTKFAGLPGAGKIPGNSGTGGGTTGGAGRAGQGGSGGGATAGYVKANFGYIQRYIRQHLEYPRQARMMNQTGVAHYSFVVEKSGKVSGVNVVKSSGFPILDKAGARAIQAASPLPAPPEAARISMPISFSLQ